MYLIDCLELQNAPIKSEPIASPTNAYATNLQNLQNASRMLADMDSIRQKQEGIAKRLEKRIRDSEHAHSIQLQQLATQQRAIETRRNQISSDRKALRENILARQQASQTAVELHTQISHIAADISSRPYRSSL